METDMADTLSEPKWQSCLSFYIWDLSLEQGSNTHDRSPTNKSHKARDTRHTHPICQQRHLLVLAREHRRLAVFSSRSVSLLLPLLLLH
mmetsp:Transcript_47370/g.118327  ORF Transcript_47370/g.118327 Transcript_47370/m.118327 type:complete len:89 (-) Transcript_47370:1798-2064(-)